MLYFLDYRPLVSGKVSGESENIFSNFTNNKKTQIERVVFDVFGKILFIFII